MNENLQKKIIDLETSLGLLQRDFETQNQMLLLDKRRIDVLEQTMARLTTQLDALRHDPSPRAAQDEKPPHY